MGAKNKKQGLFKKSRKKKNDNSKITVFKGESTDIHGKEGCNPIQKNIKGTTSLRSCKV